jgi:hypothetical protein
MYLDRELASYIILGLIIGLALGYIIGFYIPIPGATHLKTVTTTVINNTTITVPINVTRTVTYTTTVNGKVVTMTTTIIMPTTTTVVSNTTITKIIAVPITTTVNHTTIVNNTVTTYIPYTQTFTITVTENASQLPLLNMSDPASILTYIKANFGLGMLGLANLTLPLGYCIGTMWIFPNASVVYLGAWFIPQNIAQKIMTPYYQVYTFPKTGVNEYATYISPSLTVLNYQSNSYGSLGAGPAYLVNINYPGNGYIVGLYGSNTGGSLPPWGLTVSTGIYQLLSNGTYIMALVNVSYVPPSLMQLVLNPPGLCLIQVIRVKPGTPDSYIDNMTFLGAQYVAWVLTEAAWGKPAPCYWPAGWTYGYWVYRLNITEPIGANWDYYCGPKGIWLPLKP